MSFIKYDALCDFPIQNLPYGVFSTPEDVTPRIGVAIGDQILDLKALANLDLFCNIIRDVKHVFLQETLNDFMSLGSLYWKETRRQLTNLLSVNNNLLQGHFYEKVFVTQARAKMHLPAHIGNYTGFYSSLYHAANIGAMFREPNSLLPSNWRYLPIGYHCRASSVVVSGTPIMRPYGQICRGEYPTFGPSQMMDFELKVAFFFGGPPTRLGQRVHISDAEKYIFGFVLLNDWSARDIQKWEYFPLGPFLSKNMGTTISPWIVTLDALQPFHTANFTQFPPPLPYLQHCESCNFDIKLFVQIESGNTSTTVCKTNFKYLYWTPIQKIVHHTSSGCNIIPGDLMASGTISGKTLDSMGCLLEATWKGPLTLADGTRRTFLLDGDKVTITGYAGNANYRIGFGECSGVLMPAAPFY